MIVRTITPLIVIAAIFSTASAQTIVRVRGNAPPNGDGQSWATAIDNLQIAISSAPALAELWVAAGTYKPTAGFDRTASFQLRSGLGIYGGFAGNETSQNQRNAAINQTILSGEIGGAAATDNSYHVVTCDNADATAVLDGFTVTGGYANAVLQGNDEGGGVQVTSGAMTIRSCRIVNNHAVRGGGLASAGNPALHDCLFDANTIVSGGFGGGGAYAREGTTLFINCLFKNNSAAPNGFGGAAVTQANGQLEFHNCTIANNAAFFGGAMMTKHGSLRLYNSIAWGNAPAAMMGDIIANYCDIEGPLPMGVGNISLDPQFMSAGTNDFRLQAQSPCIDAGDNGWLPIGVVNDIAGLPRVADGNADTILIVDMGAHERPLPGDLDNNNVVDVFDLFVLLANWGTNNAGAELALPTSVVDVFDLFVLLGNWSN